MLGLSIGEGCGILSGVVISGDIKETRTGEGDYPSYTDVQTRKHGDQTRLETSVVHAVKHEC